MARENIFHTLSVASVMPPALIDDLVDFLVHNRFFILDAGQQRETFRTRFHSTTLVSDIVYRLLNAGKDQAYSLIRLPTKTTALREVVDMTFLPIDLKQMKDATKTPMNSVALLPELNDKIVINITDISKKTGEFSDITLFHYRIVRDFLSRSFFTSSERTWISPQLVRYVAKAYSMTVGHQIARRFGLSPMAHVFVQTAFCLFFVGKMVDESVFLDFMITHGKQMGLYDPLTTKQIVALSQDTLGSQAPQSLEDVIKLIDAFDHESLKGKTGSRLSRPILNEMFRSLYSEHHVSTISLEYPPYFLFLMILVLSDNRIGLAFSMKTLNLVKEGKDVFETILKSPGFLSGV